MFRFGGCKAGSRSVQKTVVHGVRAQVLLRCVPRVGTYLSQLHRHMQPHAHALATTGDTVTVSSSDAS